MTPLDVCGLSLILNMKPKDSSLLFINIICQKSGMYQVTKHDECWKKMKVRQ